MAEGLGIFKAPGVAVGRMFQGGAAAGRGVRGLYDSVRSDLLGRAPLQKPDGLTPRGLDAAKGNRSDPSGVKVLSLNLNGVTLNVPQILWDAECYGFMVLAQSAAFAGLTFRIGKFSSGTTDTEDFAPYVGFNYIPRDDQPSVRRIEYIKTGSNQDVTLTILIYTKPVSVTGRQPVYLVDVDGDAAQVVPFDTGGEDEAQNALAVRAALTAIDSGEAAGDQNVPIECDSAAAAAGWAAAKRGLIVNSRLGVKSSATGDFDALEMAIISAITGESHGSKNWARMASALFGRDTSDTTMRAVEAARSAVTTTQTNSLYRLLTSAELVAQDNNVGPGPRAVYGDIPSNAANGLSHSSVRGIWALATDVKRDSDGSLLTPTEMNRSVRTSTVNPADAAVLATLDCRGLTNKSLIIDSTVADDAHIEFSPEGTNWHRLATVAYGVGVTVMLTAVQFEALRGFRHVRMVQNGAAVGTVIGIISAQGA